jgi:hypothetical protein
VQKTPLLLGALRAIKTGALQAVNCICDDDMDREGIRSGWLRRSDSKSPFFELIRRMSQEELKSAVIIDTALIKVMKSSINNPLGALALYKDTGNGQSDIDGTVAVGDNGL